MITQDEAIQMADEAGAVFHNGDFCFALSDLHDFANLIRDETLLETAKMFRAAQMDDAVFMLVAYRMAWEE